MSEEVRISTLGCHPVLCCVVDYPFAIGHFVGSFNRAAIGESIEVHE
jgi:hypothetical protein